MQGFFRGGRGPLKVALPPWDGSCPPMCEQLGTWLPPPPPPSPLKCRNLQYAPWHFFTRKVRVWYVNGTRFNFLCERFCPMIAIVSVAVNVCFFLFLLSHRSRLSWMELVSPTLRCVQCIWAPHRFGWLLFLLHTHTLYKRGTSISRYLGNTDKVLNNYRGKIEDCVTVHTYIQYTVLEILVNIQTFSDHFGILYDRKRFGSDIWLCTT